jgi:hypothetical protein
MVITDIRTGRDIKNGPQDAPFSVRLSQEHANEIQAHVASLAEIGGWRELKISDTDFSVAHVIFDGEKTRVLVRGNAAVIETEATYADTISWEQSDTEPVVTEEDATNIVAGLSKRGYRSYFVSAGEIDWVYAEKAGFVVRAALGFKFEKDPENVEEQGIVGEEAIGKWEAFLGRKEDEIEVGTSASRNEGQDQDFPIHYDADSGIFLRLSRLTEDGSLKNVSVSEFPTALQMYTRAYRDIIDIFSSVKGFASPEATVTFLPLEDE